jgi:hypothetical protein
MNDDRQPRLHVRPDPGPVLSREGLIALAAGLFMGEVVAGIALHHAGSLLGLVLALTYVVSASASTVMFLLSWPGRPAGQARSPSVYAWLGLQGVGALVSLQGASMF